MKFASFYDLSIGFLDLFRHCGYVLEMFRHCGYVLDLFRQCGYVLELFRHCGYVFFHLIFVCYNRGIYIFQGVLYLLQFPKRIKAWDFIYILLSF